MRPARYRARPSTSASPQSPGSRPSSPWRARAWRPSSSPSILAAGVLRLVLLVLIIRAIALLERGGGDRAGRAAVIVRLKLLQRLGEAVLVHGQVVGDPHPVRPLVRLHVEDLLIDRGRVVDDHHDLRLRVEVGAGANQHLVDLDCAALDVRSHDLILLLPEVLEFPKLTLDLLVDLERLLSLPDATLVAGHDELSHFLDQPAVNPHAPRLPFLE